MFYAAAPADTPSPVCVWVEKWKSLPLNKAAIRAKIAFMNELSHNKESKERWQKIKKPGDEPRR